MAKTSAQYEQELAALRAQLEAAQKAGAQQARLTLKVSEKGAVSLYGLGRFPVTLYASQWARLFGHAKQVGDFIAANADKLATKDAPAPAATPGLAAGARAGETATA